MTRTEPYVFDFDRSVTLPAAIRIIVAALEDDGLALTASDNSRFGGITSVLVDGRKRVLVPAYRVVRRDGRPILRVVK